MRDYFFEGHQLYDGPGGIIDVHFEGFTEPGDYAINESNAVMKSVKSLCKRNNIWSRNSRTK